MSFPSIPVPEQIAVRAWECAWVLATECAPELSLEQHVLVAAVVIAGPESVSWDYAGDLFALHGVYRGVRV